MAHLIEVAFRGNRKDFFRWEESAPPSLKTAVIVEADRGEDLGHVHSTGELAEVRCKGCPHGCGTAPPSRQALRVASLADQLQFSELATENESARQKAMERVKANGLVMKLTDAEWQWDRKKLTFFFTSDRRVDFRTLVRELASMFRTRIELKQIGVRDEAKRLSGIGRCGREYCSSSWLPDLRPVNLAVAKDQKLSLNPSQISGACGRLMCCLRYEHEFYVESRRRFPKEGRILRTKIGDEKVLSCNIFHETLTLRSAEGDTRVVPLAELRAEMELFGGVLMVDRAVEIESQNAPFDEALMSETQEFMVARETLPMLDILVQPSDDFVKEPEPEVEQIIVDVAAETIVVVETMSVNVTPPVSDTGSAATSGVAGSPGVSPNAATNSDDEPRRKRRRGRRGGRRLRGADNRNNANSSPNSATENSAENNSPDDDDSDSDSEN
ncbi:MAG: regulatory iron-sulfur-containing complex subunit RicT [Gemmatimonadaceae bacterium]